MRTGFVAGSLLFACALTANAAEDDWQLLRRAGVASHQQPLVGTYFHQTQGTMETFSLVRGMAPQGFTELYQALDGPPREVVRRGNDVILYAADKIGLTNATFSAMRLFPTVLPENVNDLQQSYRLKRLDNDRVAQRDCTWLQLKPKDSARYSVRLCVHPESAMPLKSVTISPQGDVVEQNTFTELELGQPRDRNQLKPRLAGKLSYQMHRTPGPGAAPAPGLPDVSELLTGLPSGFKLIKVAKRNQPGRPGGSMKQYMFSDGLAMLSVFVEPASGKRAERTVALHGPVSLASRLEGDRFLTLVGDLPEQGLANLIKSVRLSNP